jgi:hypothetical protein
MKFCPECGAPVKPDKKFCTSCGRQVQSTAAGEAESLSQPPLLEHTKGFGFVVSKKVIIALLAIAGIIIALVIGTLFIYPAVTRGGFFAQGGNTTPAAGPGTVTTSSTFVIPKETTPPVVPPTGIWVHVSYIGGWKGMYGITGDLQSVSNSGERFYEIENTGGQLEAVFEKLDSSSQHPLVIEIYRDGNLLTQNSTSSPFGKVSVSFSASGSGTAQSTAVTSIQTTRKMITPVPSAPVCPSDERICSNSCKNLRTDNSNCGYCGTVCPAGKQCINGLCMANCTAGQTSCPDGCFNLLSDPNHCGSCTNDCPKGLICYMGRCESPATPMPVPV